MIASRSVLGRLSAFESPGPVNCNIRLAFHESWARVTCERCGKGPCPFFNDDGSPKTESQRRTEAGHGEMFE